MKDSYLSLTAAVAVALAADARAQQTLEPPTLEAPSLTQPNTAPRVARTGMVRRISKRFDFEEYETFPHVMPIGFHRIGPASLISEIENPGGTPVDTTRPGHPLFGPMTFSDEAPYQGNWSFLFTLKGGSMVARVAPHILPVIPGGDYMVSTAIRTRDLTHARARVTAMFLDQRGRVITESITHGPLVKTNGNWERVEVLIDGAFPEASDLVLELQLLQPPQFRSDIRPNAGPLLEDVAGRVWFDDVTIWHVSRIELTTARPGNVMRGAGDVELRVAVSDMTSEPLNATLRVFDLNGAVVHEKDFPVLQNTVAQRIVVPTPRLGWYRAVVDVRSPTTRVGSTELSFVVLPESTPAGPAAQQFGFNLERERFADIPAAVELLNDLRLGAVVLPAWDRSLTLDGVAAHDRIMRPIVESLLDDRVEMTFSLPVIPDELSAAAVLDPEQVIDLFSRPQEHWLPYLEAILVNFGQRVSRWQLGPTGDDSAFWRDDLAQATDAAVTALGRLVPGPVILAPWTTEQGIVDLGPQTGKHVFVPHQVRPETLPGHFYSWPIESRTVLLTLDQLPGETYTPQQQMTDLLLRGLQAWRLGATQLLIESPWNWKGGRRRQMIPEPALAVWSQLAQRLGKRQFRGVIPLKPGITAWLLEGENDALLALWNDSAGSEGGTFNIELGHGPVTLIDAFGNRTVIEPVDGKHHLKLTDMPVFVQGVDPNLALFRQGLAIDAPFAPAINREHHHEIVIRNPWPTTITGSVRIDDPSGWQFSPRRQVFSLGPAQEIRLPLALSFSRSEITGPKRIAMRFDIDTGRLYRFDAELDLKIGLDEITMTPTWRVVRNARGEPVDVVVSQHIVNKGDTPLFLEAFLLAPDYSRKRKLVPELGSGESIIRSFHLADGVTRLAGRSILLGVSDDATGGRLNASITFPPAPQVANALVNETNSGQAPGR